MLKYSLTNLSIRTKSNVYYICTMQYCMYMVAKCEPCQFSRRRKLTTSVYNATAVSLELNDGRI